jgi:hypothetical protein
MEDIQGEPSTQDGTVHDLFHGDNPKIIEDSVIRAVDGLQFAVRDTLYVWCLCIVYIHWY